MKYYPLTTPQKNIWNLQKYYADTSIANLCGAIFYQEKRNSALLQQAIMQFIRNQNGLRLRFCEDNEPCQYTMEEIDIDIPVLSFDSKKDFNDYVEKFVKEPIGLVDRPMYCFEVFQMDNKSGILVKLSHLVSDAWTMGLLVNQFDKAYFKLLNNTNDKLVEGNYIDFIQSESDYMHSIRYEKDKAYWEEKYAIRPEKSIIKLCPVPPKSIDAKRITRKIPLLLEQKMDRYCSTYSVTPAVLFEMAIVIYLSKINSENHKVTIGIPTLNRSNIQEKNIAGMFVSTMPLTVEIAEAITVPDLAKRITKEHIDIFRHQKYPYADILKYLREKQNFSGNLYDVMVSYQNAETDTQASTKWYSNGASEVPLVMHIDNRDGDDSHTINVDYQTAVFEDAAEVDYAIDRLEYIIEQIAEDYTKSIKDICIVPEQELRKLVYEFNDMAVNYPKDKCVHELFIEQVQKTPDKIALVFEEKQFTYRQLDEMSDSLAHFLREKGIKRNDVVPIIARRSWHVIVAMLGVLKAGGAYMPVDPSYPEERVGYMIETAKSKIALLYGYKKTLAIEQIDLDGLNYFNHVESVKNQNQAEDSCYVLYTSGTTGAPKGIEISHRNLVNFMNNNPKNIYQSYAIENGYTMLASTTFTFDISIFEIYLSLLNGLKIVMTNDNEINSQHSIVNLVKKYSVDILQSTPTKLAMLFNHDEFKEVAKEINVIMAGAEEFTPELYHKILDCTNATIFNGYGPTETTIGSSFKKIKDEDDITIGRPIANAQIYILDSNQKLLPISVAGELCIAGDGVGKGYLNQPKLTAERFLPNPFATAENGHGKVMYRTGDLARFRADGEIEYLGRMDTQIKIRGLRIELGEIESVMSSFSGILLSAAADKRDENNRQYLVGYYIAEQPIDEKELRSYLSAKLPKYMVPNYFMHLDSMPMTSSEKIDRKNLPLPDFTIQTAEYIAPETGIEKRLALIWQELLQAELIGKTDDFFECGGDSLLAITMLNRIEEEFQITVSIKDIMEYSVLEQLAQVIGQTKNTDNKILPRYGEKYVLLPQQKAIYAACSKSPELLTYNMPAQIMLPDSIDKERLKASIKDVVNHHQSLKTYISVEDDDIYGVYDPTAEINFEEYTGDTISDFLKPFDLGKAPLLRIGFTEDMLLFDMHHIIADGESLSIILRDIFRAYSGESLSDSEIQYSDYAAYYKEADFAAHKAFFRDMLKCEFEPMVLPEKKASAETGGRSKVFFLPETAVNGAKSFAKKNGLTDTMVYFGAFGILLSKYTAKEDILTSVILSNRLHNELQNVVGMFVNTLPTYFSVKGNLKKYYKRIKELILNLFQYQELPFLEITKEVGMQDKNSINTSFVFQADGEKSLVLDNQKFLPELIDTGTAKFDLSMEVTPLQEGCRVRLEYNCAKYEEKLIDDLFAAYEKILIQLNTLNIENLADISVLSDEGKNKILYEFNDTAVDYPKDKCVHELFMEQAQKAPNKTALIFEDKQITYRQLDEMSNSLAHLLREKGVKRNDVVPIIAKRSWHVIVAMLGVLKAGGAYMLIDSQYPDERISYLVHECKTDIVLTYDCVFVGVDNIDLETINYIENTESLDTVNKIEDTFCAIHTSGSTGVPKAVALSHKNLLNFIDYSFEFFAWVNQSIATTIITFDAFMLETIVALCRQITVVLLNDRQMTDQAEFESIINKYEASFLFQTPTKLLNYIRNSKSCNFLKKTKTFVIGGEVFPQELYDKMRLYNSDCDIYNGYGPAEITMGASFKKIENGNDITIGTPIANTQIYILDNNQRLLPIGVVGELCIAGDGVGKGYLNRSELTAERFLPNPFATAENGHGKVMYRTGDLARFRENGEIEYLGRIDTQVKIRGLRIELGEIESVMSNFPGILLNAVTDKRDENNRQYLVGYYTAEQAIDESELRQHLATKLPKYMVPNYFVCLDSIPMTSSGKIDRKNLPLPDFTMQTAEYIAPETEIERKLALIWQELLQTERIGKTDDFFEYGGDSLLAITMLNRIEEEFLISVSIKDIMEYSVLEQLAEVISRMERKGNGIMPQHKGKYKILPQQKAIYAACNKAPDMLLYNISTYIPLSPTVDRERLKICIKRAVDKQEALKTYFSVEGDEVYGIYDASAELVFEEYTNQTFSDFFRPFDLGKAPLIRVGFAEDKLLLDMHHIVADGESMNIMIKDIASVYSGGELSNPEIRYSDYSAYFAEADFTAHKAFFKEMLKCEFEPVALPEKRTSTETGGRSKVFLLPETVVKSVKDYAKEYELTDTMIHFGAFCILLSKYTARDDILTGVILSNRLHKELKDVVGMFVNTLPAYLSVKGNLKEYFKRAKELILNLFEYQELPFLEIEKAIGIQGKMNINTSFVYQAGEKALMLEQQELLPGFVDTGTAKFDFSMEVTPLQKGCRVRLEYNRAKYDEKLIDDLFAAYERILIQLNTPNIENLADISVLSDEEQNKILYGFNDTAVAYPKDKCVHELFVEQVQKTPDKIALIFEDKQFTYRQLDEMSNSFAYFLREKGIKRNDVVPIIAKRSWHVIVAMLGVLKSGGAYMPIDPNYPEDRIGYMLEIAKSKMALVYGYKKSLAVEQVDLDRLDYSDNVEPLENQNHSEDSCYVLFTSGTTGTPKGIEISHRNLVNFVNNNPKNMYQSYAIENGHTMLALTTFTFDISIFEIYLSLLNGLKVVMANDNEINSQHTIANLMKKHSVGILQSTPTKLTMFFNHNEFREAAKGIRVIMAGAEEFTPELYHKILDCTNAAIFNGYGPTEITIGASFKRIEGENDITIGKPIANTQIYVLDQNLKLLPTGVAGELCIAGEGVGKGYLNQPELTVERFLPNPFATAENGHGKVMYRTGDLARFKEDGEIEYLGRIDTQVKIRGLRIELGEIESVMGSFPGILLNAVTDKRDENNRQYLVGYYTAEQPVDERELRQHLSSKLPKYMVPNYFMHLESMPMTSSGKIDRKNLPLPDFNIQPTVYAPPETEQEKICCHVLEELLLYDQIGVDDDFFEIGGDSLWAIEYLAKLHDKGLRLDLQNIFDYPTVRKLCDFLEKGAEERIEYKASDFDKYHDLLMNNVIDVIDPAFPLNKKSLGNIFLTGVTGFLGAHILDSFMKEEKGKIYCLVRSNSQKDGEERIRNILQYYFGNVYDSEIRKRIIPVIGDIERDDIAEEMPTDIQTVIHTAASVKHYGSYSYFERVNVEGTRHIIGYAGKIRAKLIHVSTISVSGNSMADDFSVYRSPEEKHFAENTFYIGQPLDNVYVRSKFEAEKAVLDAMLEGLDAKIIRIGNLTNRASDYKFQPNYRQNAFLTRAKAALEFGLFPDYLMKLYSEFSPVDLTAEGVIKIAQYAEKQCIFHLNSNRPIYHNRLLEVLKRLNIPLNVVDKDTFNTALRNTMKSSNTEYIYEAFQNDMDEDGILLYDSNIRIENELTVWFLRQIGFEWNETDFEYIRGYIEYFRELGYLKV